MTGIMNQLKVIASSARVITPSDSKDIDQDPAFFGTGIEWVFVKNNTDTAATARVTTIYDQTIDVFIPAGFIEPLKVKQIHSTGTTITDLLGYY